MFLATLEQAIFDAEHLPICCIHDNWRTNYTLHGVQADVPTFEVVDLPGIQTFPEQQEQKTTQLVSKYLNKPNTLVLCVVDATTAAFDTSVALKLIRKAGKLSNTIVAMTKSDLVPQEEEYVPKIFDRILGESTDNEHLKDLAGCVAVANISASSSTPLADADTAERQIFQRMLQDPAPAFEAEEVQRQLKDNMTVRQLIVQLDRMFHHYIVQHWKPAALKTIKQLSATAQSNLTALGPPVEQVTPNDVFQMVLDKVCFCGRVPLMSCHLSMQSGATVRCLGTDRSCIQGSFSDLMTVCCSNKLPQHGQLM